MNTQGQVTIRQWFRLPKQHRRIRVAQFKAARRDLRETAKWERRLKISGEKTQPRLNLEKRVDELRPTVPWWWRAMSGAYYALAAVAGKGRRP